MKPIPDLERSQSPTFDNRSPSKRNETIREAVTEKTANEIVNASKNPPQSGPPTFAETSSERDAEVRNAVTKETAEEIGNASKNVLDESNS